MAQIMLVVTLGIFLFSIIFSFIILLSNFKKNGEDFFYYIFPCSLILTVAVYVLPLSVRPLFTNTIEGDISPYLPQFSAYIPYALALCAAFNITLSLSYKLIQINTKNNKNALTATSKSMPITAAFALILISIIMIYQLTNEVGGLFNLILLGYKVTEQLSSAGHYAVAFDWLVVAALAILYSGYTLKSRTRTFTGLAAITVLVFVFAIMGRRAVLVVLIGSAIFGYHIAVKKISLRKLVPIFLAFFVALNFIGLTRGESYQNVTDIAAIISEKNDRLSEESPGLFYAITTGNFAAPFETFPQIIRTFGSDFWPGFGAYSFRAVSFMVPLFLWEDRPLPLSNWYMKVFYDETEKNIGRQFFILTAPYMDFGPAGILFFGILLAWIFRHMARIASENQNDPLVGVFVVIFLGSMLNFVSNDALGFGVVFLKSNGIPLGFLYVSRFIHQRLS